MNEIAKAVGCSAGPVNAINRRYSIRQYKGSHVWVPKVMAAMGLSILLVSSALAMSDLEAARKAALMLGPSSNTYVKKIIIKERRFWRDKISMEYCLTFDDRGIIGFTQRREICMPTWELAFTSIPLAQPVSSELP